LLQHTTVVTTYKIKYDNSLTIAVNKIRLKIKECFHFSSHCFSHGTVATEVHLDKVLSANGYANSTKKLDRMDKNKVSLAKV